MVGCIIICTVHLLTIYFSSTYVIAGETGFTGFRGRTGVAGATGAVVIGLFITFSV